MSCHHFRWLGFLLLNVGELGNFVSYAFAPASVVAPLGTVGHSRCLRPWSSFYIALYYQGCFDSQLHLCTPPSQRKVSQGLYIESCLVAIILNLLFPSARPLWHVPGDMRRRDCRDLKQVIRS